MFIYDAEWMLDFCGQWSNLHNFIGRFSCEIDNLSQSLQRLKDPDGF